MKQCIECGKQFEFKTHNQKYCSNQCCRIATNKRIMVKYYEKRDRLSGKKRDCIECSTTLSKYNSNDLCSSCESKAVKLNTKNILKGIEGVIQGLDKTKRKKSSRN